MDPFSAWIEAAGGGGGGSNGQKPVSHSTVKRDPPVVTQRGRQGEHDLAGPLGDERQVVMHARRAHGEGTGQPDRCVPPRRLGPQLELPGAVWPAAHDPQVDHAVLPRLVASRLDFDTEEHER